MVQRMLWRPAVLGYGGCVNDPNSSHWLLLGCGGVLPVLTLPPGHIFLVCVRCVLLLVSHLQAKVVGADTAAQDLVVSPTQSGAVWCHLWGVPYWRTPAADGKDEGSWHL
jgi:hypothetical protein